MPKNPVAQSRVENKQKRDKVPSEPTIFLHAAPERGFVSISNALAHCTTISPETLGFLVGILALPKDWAFNTTWAEKRFRVGETKLKRMIREAKAAQFMITKRETDPETGQFTGRTICLFTDMPGEFSEPVSGKTPPMVAISGKTHRVENTTGGEITPHTKERKKPTKETDGAPRDFENGSEEVRRWRQRLELYRENGKWPLFNRWGPMMHQPGCLVPEALVKLWDDTNGLAFKAEPKTKRKADDKAFRPNRNGFQRIGTLNLPGTSHD